MSLRELAASILTTGERKRRATIRDKGQGANSPGVVLWEIGLAIAVCLGLALIVNFLLLAFDIR